ncbi:MAG: DNA adenine methylase [Holosporales bacterium]|jgi:DNA adenine methylase|nr:DNA adenine methylase [Holosporales bacterium]
MTIDLEEVTRGEAPQISGSSRKTSAIYLNEYDAKEVSKSGPHVKRRIAFGWYGGKFSHLNWLLPLLPTECCHYCEPFAGSGAVLLNRVPTPVETYNDIDGEVVNFFRVLRDQYEELIKLISLTPFSREEYCIAIYGDKTKISDIERARRFYIKARQTRTGLAQTASLGRWANCKTTSRAGMSGAVSRWLSGTYALDEIARRLRRVQIENRPAIDIINLYDNPQTLFYCDPPYLHATRGDSNAYGYEMSEEQYYEFAVAVNRCKGMVAISGYDHPLMDELFKHDRWVKIRDQYRTIHSTKDKRTEILWTNYKPQEQNRLFK